MSILSGFLKTKKYRKTASGYKLQSEWTSSQTVQMDDGNTLQNNLGAIKGITSSLTSTSSSYALSAAAGKNLQDQLTLKTYTIVPTDNVANKVYATQNVKAFSYGKIGFVTGTISSAISGTNVTLFSVPGLVPETACAGVGSTFKSSGTQVSCSIGVKTDSTFTFALTEANTYRFVCIFPIK